MGATHNKNSQLISQILELDTNHEQNAVLAEVNTLRLRSDLLKNLHSGHDIVIARTLSFQKGVDYLLLL